MEGSRGAADTMIDRNTEQMIETLAALDRESCVRRIRMMQRPRMDFTEDFLSSLSVERLRHILMAACLQARRPTRSARPE